MMDTLYILTGDSQGSRILEVICGFPFEVPPAFSNICLYSEIFFGTLGKELGALTDMSSRILPPKFTSWLRCLESSL
jgi:hypothetical protein